MTLIPDTLKYTTTHEWAKADGLVVTVGITKFAADQLSDITYVEMPDVGDHVFAGKEFGTIETVKAVSSLYSPVDGEVVEIHGSLEEKPDPITADPFGDGWIVKIRVEKPAALDALLSPADYKKQIENEAH